MPHYGQQAKDRAAQMFMAGADPAAIAAALGIKHKRTVDRWAEQYGWEAKRAEAEQHRSPLVVQEELESVAGEELTKLMRLPAPDPESIARWQDIASKCRANIRGILEQARDPEIFCRWTEMFARYIATLPDDKRRAVSELIDPLVNGFKDAIQAGRVTP